MSSHGDPHYNHETLVRLLIMGIPVKVQFNGPKLYKKTGALFQEESYLEIVPPFLKSSGALNGTFTGIPLLVRPRLYTEPVVELT